MLTISEAKRLRSQKVLARINTANGPEGRAEAARRAAMARWAGKTAEERVIERAKGRPPATRPRTRVGVSGKSKEANA